MVVGIGEVLWDILPDGKKLGGAPGNFAYHVSQFGLPGLPGLVISAVGPDADGREIIEKFDSIGLSHHIETVPYPTGTVQVEIEGHGMPRYDIKEDVAWDNIPLTSEIKELAAKTRAVCFGSLAQRNIVSRRTIYSFLDLMAGDEDRLVIFDANLRQHFYTKEVLHDSMQRCNILKINDEELEIISRMFGTDNEADFQRKCRLLLAEYNLKILILTCGAAGSYVFTPEKESFMSVPEVEVADTVGAGDSFTATFVAMILRGASIEEAHAKAAEVSAYVCSCHGAMPLLPAGLTD